MKRRDFLASAAALLAGAGCVGRGGSSGGTISGYSTDQGNLNGSTTVGSSPSVCAGVNGTTVHS